MARKLIIPLLILLCFAQRDYGQVYSDSMDYHSILVNGLRVNSLKNTVISVFGHPSLIKTDTNNYGEKYYRYTYKRTIIEISKDGAFSGFTLKDARFTLCSNGKCFKVGDPLSKLAKLYPASYILYLDEYKNDHTVGEQHFRISFKDSDSWLIVDCVNNIVTGIETWDPL